VLSLGAIGLALLAVSCGTTDESAVAPLQIEGATYVGDKACVDCHANITREFPASQHGHLSLGAGGMPGQYGCESCHGPASRHVALGSKGGLEKFILNPGKDPAACLRCHTEVEAEFNFPEHHPVLEGKMNCVECHDPHGADIMKPAGGLAMARLNETCAQCHREETKPVVYEHPAMREGCTACHNPHGSINVKLLTVLDSNLCLRCHAQVEAGARIFIGGRDHTTSLAMGACWTAGCHVAVHGSNVHPILLY
jgi:predicted CXXCH cytochrome family protein